MKDVKDAFNQMQDKAVQVVDLAKWKIYQQSQLSKLSGEIRAFENGIKEKKAQLADTILVLHAQGKKEVEEIRGICKEIEQLNMGKNRKLKEKSDVEAQQPPQIHLIDNFLPASASPKPNDDELSALLSQAESALQGGHRGRAAGLINQALQIDYMYPASWVLLQQSLGSQQNPNDFQLEFTKKYFPDKLGALVTSTQVAQQPSNVESPAVLQRNEDIQASQRNLQINLVEKLPERWFQRLFTILGTICLWAPWVLIPQRCNSSAVLDGKQIMLQMSNSINFLDPIIGFFGILGLAILFFVSFKSSVAQKWGERLTISFSALAAFPAVEIIASKFAQTSNIIELKWGIWAYWVSFGVVGLVALINNTLIEKLPQNENLDNLASICRFFVWLITIGNGLMVILVLVGMATTGMNLQLSALMPSLIWLGIATFLSHKA